MAALVIRRDSDIDELGRGVGVTQSDYGDVNIRGFFDGLGIGTGVGDNNEARLFKRTSDVIGEVTRSETTSDGSSASVSSELQNSTLTERTSRDSANVGRVVNCSNNSRGEDDLFPKSN